MTMAAAILLAFASLGLIRTGGFTAGMKHDFAWRWTPTPEERLLAAEPTVPSAAPAPAAAPAAAPVATPASAPAAVPASRRPPRRRGTGDAGTRRRRPSPQPPARRRRGAAPPGRVAGLPRAGPRRDRARHPHRDRLERDAPGRAVAPRRRAGLVVVRRRRQSRLHAGAARRGRGGRVLRRVDRRAGVAPSRPRALLGIERRRGPARHADAERRPRLRARRHRHRQRARRRDRGARLVAQRRHRHRREAPDWGFSGSPIVVDDLVVVAVSGALAAYDAATGQPRWKLAPQGEGYSSPQLVTLGGVRQVAFVNGEGITGVAPSNGAVLWANAWKGYPIVQPAVTADGDLLVQRQGRSRPAAPLGDPERVGVDGDGALDHPRPQAVLQRLRRPQGPRLRLRRQHPRLHRPRRRHPQVEGRPVRQRAAGAARRSGCAARARGRGRAGARGRDAGRASSSSGVRPASTARPGITRWWSATASSSATARRWRRSAAHLPRADQPARLARHRRSVAGKMRHGLAVDHQGTRAPQGAGTRARTRGPHGRRRHHGCGGGGSRSRAHRPRAAQGQGRRRRSCRRGSRWATSCARAPAPRRWTGSGRS